MEFRCETVYDRKALAAMARGIRKTAGKKRSRRAHVLGWIVIALGTFLIIDSFASEGAAALTAPTVINIIAVLAILTVFLWEDKINGAIAGKRTLPILKKAVTVFREDGYSTENDFGKSELTYEHIVRIAELPGYFVFVFSGNHGQVYAKCDLTGGSTDEFREFLERVAGKKVEQIR